MIAPDEIAADEDYIPLDYTRLNSRELGAVHSRYAVRHSHGLFELAKKSADMASLIRDLKLEEARFRTLYKDDYKTKWELDDAMLLDDDMGRMYEKLKLVEIQVHILDGVVKGYDGLARAASREISRRISEQAPRD